MVAFEVFSVDTPFSDAQLAAVDSEQWPELAAASQGGRVPRTVLRDAICHGLRPKLPPGSAPRAVISILEQCWAEESEVRPDASAICAVFGGALGDQLDQTHIAAGGAVHGARHAGKGGTALADVLQQ